MTLTEPSPKGTYTELIARLNRVCVDLLLAAEGPIGSYDPDRVLRKKAPKAAGSPPHGRRRVVVAWVERLNAELAAAEDHHGLGRASNVVARAVRVLAAEPGFVPVLTSVVEEAERTKTGTIRDRGRVSTLRREVLNHPTTRVSRRVEQIDDERGRAILRRERDRAGLTDADLARLAAPELGISVSSLVQDLCRFFGGTRPLRRDRWTALVLATLNA